MTIEKNGRLQRVTVERDGQQLYCCMRIYYDDLILIIPLENSAEHLLKNILSYVDRYDIGVPDSGCSVEYADFNSCTHFICALAENNNTLSRIADNFPDVSVLTGLRANCSIDDARRPKPAGNAPTELSQYAAQGGALNISPFERLEYRAMEQRVIARMNGEVLSVDSGWGDSCPRTYAALSLNDCQFIERGSYDVQFLKSAEVNDYVFHENTIIHIMAARSSCHAPLSIYCTLKNLSLFKDVASFSDELTSDISSLLELDYLRTEEYCARYPSEEVKLVSIGTIFRMQRELFQKYQALRDDEELQWKHMRNEV